MGISSSESSCAGSAALLVTADWQEQARRASGSRQRRHSWRHSWRRAFAWARRVTRALLRLAQGLSQAPKRSNLLELAEPIAHGPSLDDSTK
jgi:hypothetical protein